jgi:microsomal dipeptidase-like Zn-dependent dipeptidase
MRTRYPCSTEPSNYDAAICGNVVAFGRPDLHHRRAKLTEPRPASGHQLCDGLESRAHGKNIIRGLIARGYADHDIELIAGENAIALLRRTIG